MFVTYSNLDREEVNVEKLFLDWAKFALYQILFHLCNNSEVAVWILPHLQNLDSAQLLSRLPHVTRLILEKCAYKVTLDDFFSNPGVLQI